MKDKIFWEKAITKILHRYFATDPAGEKMKPLSTLFPAHAAKLLALLAFVVFISSGIIYMRAISTEGKGIALAGSILGAILIVGCVTTYRRRRSGL